MKLILWLLLLSLSQKIYSQERIINITDSLIKIKRVKTRTLSFPAWPQSASIITRFNENGNAVETINTDSYGKKVPTLKTTYFYDSLGKIRSINTFVITDSISKVPLVNHSFQSIHSSIINFEYDSQAKLTRAYINDSLGHLTTEFLYSYDPIKIITKWYNNRGILISQMAEYFEKENILSKSVSNDFDSSGKAIAPFKLYTFKNTFNSKGQLKETYSEVFSNWGTKKQELTANTSYEYYKNGLLKSIDSGSYTDWKLSYEYY